MDLGGKELSLGDKFVQYLYLLPLSLTNSIFKLGSIHPRDLLLVSSRGAVVNIDIKQ